MIEDGARSTLKANAHMKDGEKKCGDVPDPFCGDVDMNDLALVDDLEHFVEVKGYLVDESPPEEKCLHYDLDPMLLEHSQSTCISCLEYAETVLFVDPGNMAQGRTFQQTQSMLPSDVTSCELLHRERKP